MRPDPALSRIYIFSKLFKLSRIVRILDSFEDSHSLPTTRRETIIGVHDGKYFVGSLVQSVQLTV